MAGFKHSLWLLLWEGVAAPAAGFCSRWRRLPAARGWPVLLVGGTTREGGREDKEERRRMEKGRSYAAPLKYMARSNLTLK